VGASGECYWKKIRLLLFQLVFTINRQVGTASNVSDFSSAHQYDKTKKRCTLVFGRWSDWV